MPLTGTWAIPRLEITPGEHYYYVRVIQEDNNMAWASPIWVNYQP